MKKSQEKSQKVIVKVKKSEEKVKKSQKSQKITEKTAKSHEKSQKVTDEKSKSHSKSQEEKSHVQKNFSKLPLVVRRDAFMFMFFGSGCHEPATYSVPFAGAIPTLWLVFPDAECSNGVPVPLVEQNQQRDAGIG